MILLIVISEIMAALYLMMMDFNGDVILIYNFHDEDTPKTIS